MYERDYLVRLFVEFAAAIRRSWERAEDEEDPAGAADLLEMAVGDATEIDGATLLALAPESIAAVLQVSGTDPRVIEYVVRSLLLAGTYRAQAGQGALAALRAGQARALADAYGIKVDDDATSRESFERLFEESSRL